MPRRLEPSRSTKSGGKAQGVGFRGPPEEATMAAGAALSRTPHGQRYPGPALSRGGS